MVMVNHLTPIRLLLIIAAASLVNILPLILYNISGDIDFHLVLIECFARQFWQGDIYPRWCMDANALGSSLPLFYFPLSYYVAALLYPLSHLGMSVHGIYTLSLLLATMVTVLTCYLWLRDIVSPGPRAACQPVIYFHALPHGSHVLPLGLR